MPVLLHKMRKIFIKLGKNSSVRAITFESLLIVRAQCVDVNSVNVQGFRVSLVELDRGAVSKRDFVQNN